MFNRENWYHGHINRETANKVLADKGMIDGSFLVRDKQPGIFVLTYAYNKKIFHYILNQDAVDGWVIHGNKNEKWGRTLESLIKSLGAEVIHPFPIRMVLPIAPTMHLNTKKIGTEVPGQAKSKIQNTVIDIEHIPGRKISNPENTLSDDQLAMLVSHGNPYPIANETSKKASIRKTSIEAASNLELQKKVIDG